jgi:signal transduction histidine kinase/HAMP domain-containing protein
MKISTKLLLAVFVPMLLALTVGSALLFSYLALETAQDNGDKVRLIRNSISELNHLVFSYVTYREERPKEQFLAEYEKMTALLAGVRFRNPDQQQLLKEIRENSRSMKATFLKLVADSEHSGPAGSNKLLRETVELLEEQLLIRSYKADSIASTLRSQVDNDIRNTQRREITLIFLVLGLTTIPFIVALTRIRKRIVTALTKLHRETGVVSSGILDHVIKVEANDEIGDLTRAFNRMTAKLKEMTASKEDLEREMSKREKVEAELRTSRKFLEIANRHLELKSMFHDFVSEIKKLTGCEAVGIRLRDENGNIPYTAYLGFSQKFYETESPLSLKTDHCMCSNVVKGATDPGLSFYTEGGSFYMNGTTRFLATVSEEDKGQTRDVCNQTGYESVALIPIRLGTNILGLIHLADRQENRIPLNTVVALEQAATALGIGIQRTLAEELLKKAHDELEVKVAERTEELMAEINYRKRTEEALRESEEELRYLSSQILVAQEKERREIAADLHDNTWQILNTIRLDIDRLFSQIMANDFGATLQSGKRITALIRGAIEKVRTMQGELWPPVLDDIGLLAAINWYGREFEKSHAGVSIEIQIGVSEEEVPQEIKIVIYRVMQEALKNAATHSGASQVLLALKKYGPRLEIELTDNGQGFDLEQILFRSRAWAGFGLISMKERIEHSGGTFEVNSREGMGTTVRAAWPLIGADQKIGDPKPIRPIFKKEEESFRMVVETISDWVYSMRVDADDRFVWDWITPGFMLVTGHGIDADLSQILYPEDKTIGEERLHFIRALRPHVCEYRIVTKGGEICWVRDTINPMADPFHPGTIRVIGAAQNITERKRSENLDRTLSHINELIHSSFDFDEILPQVLSEAAKAVECETAAISVRREEEWVVSYVYGFPKEIIGTRMSDEQEPHAVLAIRTQNPVVVNDAFNDDRVNREHMKKWGIRSVMVVPLVTEDQVIGVIFLNHQKGIFNFDKVHVDFAKKLAFAVSLAAKNVRNVKDLQFEMTERKKVEVEVWRQVEELKAVNEELTRFNRAAVNRELRMIELKKQINDLCVQTGQPPRYPLDFQAEQGPPRAAPEVH